MNTKAGSTGFANVVMGAFLFLTACGQKGVGIDPALVGFVETYMSLAPTEGNYHSLRSVRFGTLPDNLDGECQTRTQAFGLTVVTTREVVIRPGIEQTAHGQRAIFHELGHCIHGLEHTDNADDIMSGVDEEERETYWKANLDTKLMEMFR